MSEQYPTLESMGVTSLQEIERYSLHTTDDTDVLRIVYKRQKGSLLPSSKKYHFGRSANTFVTDSGSSTIENVREISPSLLKAIAELDSIVNVQLSGGCNAKHRRFGMGQPVASSFNNWTPELELEFQRNSDLGYEEDGSFGSVRCLEHGVPNPLIRWHYHEEYELHLIVETSGKVFVGDYIGNFEPGHLVLTGPRLPHNWVSSNVPEQGVPVRDRALQFSDEPLRKASEFIPELRGVLPLLGRASHGIEFIGISDQVAESMQCIKDSTGITRFTEFLHLLQELARHDQYNLLSSARLQSFDGDDSLKHMSEVVDYITENYGTSFSMADICERFGMSSSYFSRYFQRATGNTFTDFVNRVRINRACILLMETDQYVSTICYTVGFNNIANFNRRFMDLKGMTPSEFRRQGQARFG